MDTVSTMLDGEHPHEILVDEVLKVSGVSRGSLYHHFGDFPSLVQTTLLHRFSQNVDADSRAMLQVVESSTSKDDYWKRIRELSALTQLPSRAPARAERARLVSLASSDAQFGKALAREQERVTQAVTDAIAQAQRKGWVNAELDARAIAVFLQAYSLGRAVDDVAEPRVANADWQRVVEAAIESFQG